MVIQNTLEFHFRSHFREEGLNAIYDPSCIGQKTKLNGKKYLEGRRRRGRSSNWRGAVKRRVTVTGGEQLKGDIQ